MKIRCEECDRYIDGVTSDAQPHPVYDSLCIGCGKKEIDEEEWTEEMQRRREAALYDVQADV